MFIEFCVGNELVVTNTRFKKTNKYYRAYTYINTNGFCAPWTRERFQMLDMCLAPNRWNNSVPHVRSVPNISLNSDHALLVVGYGVILAKVEKMQRTKSRDTEHRMRNIRKPITKKSKTS